MFSRADARNRQYLNSDTTVKADDPRLANLKPFPPGTSGNPSGRKKGSLNLTTILRRMLEEEVEVTDGGKKVKKPLSDVLVQKLIKKAVKDDNLKAISEIFDRVDGKAKQTIEATVSNIAEPDALTEEQKKALLESEEKLRAKRRDEVLKSFEDIDKDQPQQPSQ